MGCVSSKLFKKELTREIILNNNGATDSFNHVVSLTSTTYGALKLETTTKENLPVKDIVEEIDKNVSKQEQQNSPPREEPAEVINTWELMEDLEEVVPVLDKAKKSPKIRPVMRGLGDSDTRTPMKFLSQIGSPRKAKTFGGKENKVKKGSDFSPRPVFRANNSSKEACKAAVRLSYPLKATPIANKTESLSSDSSVSSQRRCFSPLFDPELVALYEKELTAEGEQVKRIISLTPRTQKFKTSSVYESLLKSFEQKCPPGGENSVVIYSTTLRGIRKTFEDCNIVRSIIESHHIQVFERDVSMDSGFKEELRRLMGTKEVKVPVVFVKGRLIGGAEEVMKLDEEGKLGVLFEGIPRGNVGGCEACGGVRFVMCVECNGSCKVLDVEEKKMVKCGECNENGLIHCPACC